MNSSQPAITTVTATTTCSLKPPRFKAKPLARFTQARMTNRLNCDSETTIEEPDMGAAEWWDSVSEDYEPNCYDGTLGDVR